MHLIDIDSISPDDMKGDNLMDSDIEIRRRDFCIACNADGIDFMSGLKDRFYDIPGNWNISKCNNPDCRLVWLNPSPIKEDIWKTYSSYYTHKNTSSKWSTFLKKIGKGYLSLKYGYQASFAEKAMGLIAFLFPTERVEFDFEVLYLKKPKNRLKLLDVGCGNGRFLLKLNACGWEVQGTEIDQKAVDYCKSKGLNVVKGEVTELNFENNSFDVITINHVIEHHFDPITLLKKCNSLLNSDGKLIVLTPNSKSHSFQKFKSSWYHLDPPRHLFIFNPDNLSIIAEKAGFELIDVKTTSRNEFWVYHTSQIIRKKAAFRIMEGKKSISGLIIGKFYQMFIWLLLFFYKDAGSEIVLKAKKK